MNFRTLIVAGAGLCFVPGCTVSDKELLGYQDPAWGEANRATMAAQVVNPHPDYDALVPPTSAQNAVNAIDRYRAGNVEQPDRQSTTESISTGPN